MLPLRLKNAWPFLLISLFAFLAFGGALNNDYVWDDRYFLVDYAWLDDFQSALKTAFTPLFQYRSYVRPIPLLTLYAESLAFGRNPAISHAINLGIHVCCAFLIYLLAKKALVDGGRVNSVATRYAAIVAVLFAVHPALSEATVWISSRFDLLATLFILVIMLVADSQLKDTPRALLVGALFLLGALCKESIAPLPAVLVAHASLKAATQRGDGTFKISDAFTARDIKMYVSLLAAGCAYLLVRRLVLAAGKPIALEEFSLLEQLVRFGTAIAKYLQLTFLPFVGNSPHHTFAWSGAESIGNYAPYLLVSGIFLTFTGALFARSKPSGLLLAAWIVSFAPVLHLLPIPIGENVVQQRFMYFPTAILLALSPHVATRMKLSAAATRAAPVAAMIFIALSILVSRSITPVWKDDLTLWTWTVQADPKSVEAKENLIWAYLNNGMYDEAEDQLRTMATAGTKTSYNVAINMGAGYYNKGDFDTSLYYYDMAYKERDSLLSAQKAILLSNMSVAYAMRGDPEKARNLISEARDLDPLNHVALGNLISFCRGKVVRTTGTPRALVARAETISLSLDQLLRHYQPELYRSPRLCPKSQLARPQ